MCLSRYNFLAREEEAAELERMTLKDVQQTYETFLRPSSQAARRLCIHVVGKGTCTGAGERTALPGQADA